LDEDRQEFDMMKKRRDIDIAEAKRQREKEKQEEEQQLARRRKEVVHRAQPVRQYKRAVQPAKNF